MRPRAWLPWRRLIIETTLSYNADGLRYQKEDDSGTRRFVWDQKAYLVEADENNSPQVVYTQEPTEFGALISQRRLSNSIWTPSYDLLDGLGSTVRLIDSGGLITDLYAYKAFGEPSARDRTTTFGHAVNLGARFGSYRKFVS